MKHRRTFAVLLSSIALALGAAPATSPSATQPAMITDLGHRLIPPTIGAATTISLVDHPHADVISRAIDAALSAAPTESTSLDRGAYLSFIDHQVAITRTYQDADGRIIDPVDKKEVQYATPCFAHAVSVLASSGHTHDASLIEAGMRAMDRAVWEMVNAKAADNHGDFFTWPTMLALGEYRASAAPERWQRWRDDLAKIDPSKLYNFYNNRQSLNWVLVHTSGEFLREQYGMTDGGYIESMLDKQDHHFTPDGQYAEGGEPIAYDLFSRLFLTGMLAHGYDGHHADLVRERMWRAAWMSMLMQSPTGEAPTGHRSSQHIWVEAEQCVIFEAFAHASADAKRLADAAMFKRAAHLSLRTLSSWLRPDGSGYVVKNKFPIDARFGYESYSAQTQYNLLACSMAAQAYQLADDRIAETSAPADAGGYVLQVDPFHKVFASAGGGYVEYETRGDTDDRNWVPCGIVRVHLLGANAQLGPADGTGVYENKKSSDDPCYAVGPAWQDASGKWTRLASLRPKTPPTVEAIEQSPQRVIVRIRYALDGGVSVTQQISVEPKRVTIQDTVSGAQAIRAYFPMLVNDGLEDTKIAVNGPSVELMKTAGGPVRFEVSGVDTLVRSGINVNSRNGIVEPIYGEVKGSTVSYVISTR